MCRQLPKVEDITIWVVLDTYSIIHFKCIPGEERDCDKVDIKEYWCKYTVLDSDSDFERSQCLTTNEDCGSHSIMEVV